MSCSPLPILLAVSCFAAAAEPPSLTDAILFRASFDRTADAELAKGDGRIYTAESLARKESKAGLHTDAVTVQRGAGRRGGALRFSKKTKQLVFFKAAKNVPYQAAQFSGSVSLWMKLDPQRDLPKGFVDPLQITDKKWNDASFFVDFDQAKERDFRLGVFSDYAFWNPSNRDFDKLPIAERPMITVKRPPFSADQWTHIAFTWQQFNAKKSDAEATLFINGALQGTLRGQQQFSWDPAKAVIMLGINYIGLMDEVTIYGRALSQEEVRLMAKLP